MKDISIQELVELAKKAAPVEPRTDKDSRRKQSQEVTPVSKLLDVIYLKAGNYEVETKLLYNFYILIADKPMTMKKFGFELTKIFKPQTIGNTMFKLHMKPETIKERMNSYNETQAQQKEPE